MELSNGETKYATEYFSKVQNCWVMNGGYLKSASYTKELVEALNGPDATVVRTTVIG